MRVLAIVPARGGSKGIPRKNLATLCGRALLAYTADAIRQSRSITRAIVSSDDPEIIGVAKAEGLEAPFVRPEALSGDRRGSAEVAQHALGWIEREEGQSYDIVVLLEPTAPLRMGADIDAAISKLAQTSEADAVVSVCQLEAPHPYKMQVVEEGRLKPLLPQHWREGLRRQDLPTVYFLNGAVYVARAHLVRDRASLWGARTLAYVMPPERSVNIDSLVDLALAEVLLRAPIRQ